MDLFFQELYLEYIYLWILGNKDYYEENGNRLYKDVTDIKSEGLQITEAEELFKTDSEEARKNVKVDFSK